MAKLWERMSEKEKLEWLLHRDQSTREVIEGISARLDEVGAVVVELEKQIKELQNRLDGRKGSSRPVLKLSAR